MKLLKNPLLFIVSALAIFSACKKTEVPKELGDRGQTIVKLMTEPNEIGYNYNLVNIDVKATSQTVGFLDVRRDVPNAEELNKTLTVTLIEDSALLNTFNVANQRNLLMFPTSGYTIDPTTATKSGNTITVTFQPGEFAKQIKYIIPNSSTIDLNNAYAIPYTIVAAVTGDGTRVSFNNRSTIVEIGPKNQWDGVYSITGTALRAGDPVLSGPFGPYQRDFVTSGPTSVQFTGSVPWANGGGSQLPDGYQPKITIDPATNKITSLVSPNGAISMTNPPINITSQKYDPATKTFYFEFTYGAGPASRLFSFTAKYVKPR